MNEMLTIEIAAGQVYIYMEPAKPQKVETYDTESLARLIRNAPANGFHVTHGDGKIVLQKEG